MVDVKKENPMGVRTIKKDPWSMKEYGERLFSVGGNLYGSKSQMFKLSMAAACLDVLSQDVSKTKIYLRRRVENGSEIVKPNEHPIAKMLDVGPNEFTSNTEFLRTAAINLSIHSEYYFACRRTNGGDAIEFTGIPCVNVSETSINVAKRKVYHDIKPSSLYDQMLFGWAEGKQDQDTVKRVIRRTMDGTNVISTAGISGQALSLLASMGDQQSNQYKNGGIPTVAFSFPDGLTDEQFKRLQDGLQVSLKNAQDNGTPVILEGKDGETPKVIPLSQVAGGQEFVKSSNAAAMDVIRFFRVPPHKVYLMESIKYDNMAPAERTYVDDTLKPLFIDIQDGLNRVCLTDKEREEYFIEFDIQSAYAMEPAEWQEIVESRWKNGLYTKNEARAAIGENQIGPDGDVYMFSSNFAITNQENEILIMAGGKDPSDEDNDGDDKPGKKPKESGIVRLVSKGN